MNFTIFQMLLIIKIKKLNNERRKEGQFSVTKRHIHTMK